MIQYIYMFEDTLYAGNKLSITSLIW